MDLKIYEINDDNINIINNNNIIIDDNNNNINDDIEQMKNEEKKINKNNIYRKNFLNKNENKIKEKVMCDICLGTYTYFNKTSHNKTKKHKLFLQKINKNN